MKNILIILSIFFCSCASAQVKTLELNKGEYLKNSLKDDFVGDWKTNDEAFKISISAEKKHIKRGALDVYVDCLTVRINSLLSRGVQIANQLSSEMSLISVGNNNSFIGIYKDEVSGNNVKISVQRINSDQLLFTTMLPEIDFANRPEKGFVLPKNATLVRK